MNRPPPNPHAAAARAAICEAMQAAGVLPADIPAPALPEHAAEYHLTWSGSQSGVIALPGQYRYTESGDVEAWYSAAQLEAALHDMELIQIFKVSRIDSLRFPN